MSGLLVVNARYREYFEDTTIANVTLSKQIMQVEKIFLRENLTNATGGTAHFILVAHSNAITYASYVSCTDTNL
jgi:hypothetical protein